MSIRSLCHEVRTIRQFAAESVPRELLLRILDDAVWAPNHRLREPWRFICFEGETIGKLAAAIGAKRHEKMAETISGAPAVIIVTAKKESNEHTAGEDFAAACCLIQNVRLLGWDRGLGISWDLADYSDCPALFPLAGIGADERIAGILAVGFMDRQDVPPTRASSRSLLASKLEVW